MTATLVLAAVWLVATATAATAAAAQSSGMAAAMAEMSDMGSMLAPELEKMTQDSSRSGAAVVMRNHTLHPLEVCSDEHHLSVYSLTGTCSCLPRPTVVQLPANNHGASVYSTDIRSGEFGCGVVTVQEHVQCHCGCTMTDADCDTPGQEFNHQQCRCQCREQKTCAGEGRHWDSESCRCVCARRKHCSSGYAWSEEYCKCMMVMPTSWPGWLDSDDTNEIEVD